MNHTSVDIKRVSLSRVFPVVSLILYKHQIKNNWWHQTRGSEVIFFYVHRVMSDHVVSAKA